MNPFDVLRSPDDGTRLGEDLSSEGGVHYRRTASGVLDLLRASHPGMPAVYRTDTLRKWRAILDERIRYYTTRRSVAGRLASVTYRRIEHFNRPEFKGRWLLGVGCGDGAQVALLEDRARYIGIDIDLWHLEILKERFPEVTAVYADAARLPLADGSVGGVFSSNAFEHIWHLEGCVLELARWQQLSPAERAAKVKGYLDRYDWYGVKDPQMREARLPDVVTVVDRALRDAYELQARWDTHYERSFEQFIPLALCRTGLGQAE